MSALDALLREFDLALLPHERFFVARGLCMECWHRDENLPFDMVPCAYLDAPAHDARTKAHFETAFAFRAVKQATALKALPADVMGKLLAWAVVELRLQMVSSFSSFALLFEALAGRRALALAPALYAAGALHPEVKRARLLGPEALAAMVALQDALP